MFRLFCRKFIQNASSSRISQECRSNHHVCFIHTQSLKSNSNISNSTNYDIPTVSYLVEKCGLSFDSAILASTKIYRNIESTDKPDSVLELFKTYGFTQTQIANLITKCPRLILADSVKTIKPKFDYFESSLGFSKSNIVKIVCSNASMFHTMSIKKMTPRLSYLKSFLDTNDDIINAFKRFNYMVVPNFSEVESNISVLQHLGVLESNISKLVSVHPHALTMKNDRFKEIVKEIVDMGFGVHCRSFVYAIGIMGVVGNLLWEKKIEAYKSFGMSQNDLISAFKLQPFCMLTSEKKIRILMHFYMNELGFTASNIAKYPNLMLVSLEKRIFPRCSVLQVLLQKGLLEKDLNLMYMLIEGKKPFEKKYVNKYNETAAEVLKAAYQGELGDPDFEKLRALLQIEVTQY